MTNIILFAMSVGSPIYIKSIPHFAYKPIIKETLGLVQIIDEVEKIYELIRLLEDRKILTA